MAEFQRRLNGVCTILRAYCKYGPVEVTMHVPQTLGSALKRGCVVVLQAPSNTDDRGPMRDPALPLPPFKRIGQYSTPVLDAQ
eukprot:34055-Eustigmatos_ZCMA.PRE.1